MELNTIHKIEESFGTMWIENGIVMASFKPGAICDLKVAKRLLEGRLQLVNGKSYPTFSDTTNGMFWTKEARDFMSTPENNVFISAGAMVISSEVVRIITNFWLNLFKPPFPMKLFTNKDEALKWLEQYKE